MGKPGCHLCDDADLVIQSVVKKFSNVVVEHGNLHEKPEWETEYSEKIPVVHIDDQEFAYWHVDAQALAEALLSRGALPQPRESE
jgi:glutaredoxin